MDVPTIVYVLWWATLAIAVLIVLPIVVYLLHRLLRAARQIEHYAASTLEAAAGIAGNTANVTALNQTIEGAGGIVETSQSIEAHTATIEMVLAERAGH